jgi:hypothetical protein
MEQQNTNTLLGILALVISVGTTIIGIINHKRIRSKCCSKKVEIQFDIDSTIRHPISSIAPATPPAKPKEEV